MANGPEGLEDVVAAHTVLSDVDGAAGRLLVRGEPVEALCGRVGFETMVRRLWDGFFEHLPDDLQQPLGEARSRVFTHTAALDDELARREPMEALRALTARLADGEDLETALNLLAAPAVFTAAIARRRRSEAPIAPDPRLGHSADALRMLAGAPASQERAWALDGYLVTVMDHGLNASTFAARVAASTRAGLTSAVVAGLSALKGPLHGGAPGPVIDMLDDIGEAANARPWLEAALQRGDRLMGFGHRIYRVRDPRADALKAVVKRLNERADAWTGRLALAEAVEAAALAVLRERKPGRSLDVNVEFYTALLLEALAFPRDAFTCVFAMGRTAGWIAHAREQIATGRIVRPQSVYVGPRPSLAA
ncbi:MAG TPA: citrate synthase/methylcitrate synthase [Caulobacteraceae bacterium]|nr:citrate synthase/methylcitrate synthase [Caulobacteraceae bacterium]